MENPKEEIEAILNEMNFTNTFEVQKELFTNGSNFEVSDEEFEEHLNPALYNAYIFDTDLAKEVRDKYEIGPAQLSQSQARTQDMSFIHKDLLK